MVALSRAIETAQVALDGARACLAALVGPEPVAPKLTIFGQPDGPCSHPNAIDLDVGGGGRTRLCPDCDETLRD